MNEDSAPSFSNSRGWSVEEIPSVPPPISPEETIPASIATEQPVVVETIPPLANVAPPAMPASVPPVNITPPQVENIMPSNIPPGGHNVHGKPHPIKKLLFLIPAVLLVATIFFVAKFTGNNYTMREPAPIVSPEPSLPAATLVPTPTPIPTKVYKSDELLIQMEIPQTYEVLSENKDEIKFGKENREILIVSRGDTDYTKEEAEEITIGGKDAVKFANIVYVTESPNYQFASFAENDLEKNEVDKIYNSVIFLIDTSDWETFDNATFGYSIKYPPNWEENTQMSNENTLSNTTEISKAPNNKTLNTLVIQTSPEEENAALTASQIVSSSRTLSGWARPPKIELKKLGGGDAQVIQGELSGKWRAYVVIWYKNTVIQMTWDDEVTKGEDQVFQNMLASFEFTT